MTRRTTLFLVCAFEIALLLFVVTNEPLAQESDWDIRLECFHSEHETKLKLQFDTDNQMVNFDDWTKKYKILTRREFIVPENKPSFFGEFQDLKTPIWFWNNNNVFSADNALVVIINYTFDTEKLVLVEVAYYLNLPEQTSVNKYRCVNPIRLN